MPKDRSPIPEELSVEVLFLHDHTCCVCRENGKAVQIHHIDDDPSNNSRDNLAVLCLQHHNDTQVAGGFGRTLRADEARRYRDDWVDRVKSRPDGPAHRSLPGRRSRARRGRPGRDPRGCARRPRQVRGDLPAAGAGRRDCPSIRLRRRSYYLSDLSVA
jgi:hypothetical protein